MQSQRLKTVVVLSSTVFALLIGFTNCAKPFASVKRLLADSSLTAASPCQVRLKSCPAHPEWPLNEWVESRSLEALDGLTCDAHAAAFAKACDTPFPVTSRADAGGSVTEFKPTGEIKGYDVIVVAGQSNATGVGRGPFADELTAPEVDGLIFQTGRNYAVCDTQDEGLIVPAKDYLKHWDGCLNSNYIGFGMAFARRYTLNRLRANRRVLLIPTALGGSSSLQWYNPSVPGMNGGPNLYVDMAARTRTALALPGLSNKPVAFLWAQGETEITTCDSQSGSPPDIPSICAFDLNAGAPPVREQWRIRLTEIFTRFRTEFGAEIPVLTVGFTPDLQFWRVGNVDTEVVVLKNMYMSELRTLPSKVPFPKYSYIETTGLTSNREAGFSIQPEELDFNYDEGRVHYSAAAQIEIGRRLWTSFKGL